jgi:hypothetical protein
MTEKKSFNREAAKRNPETVYKRPLQILDEKSLTRGEKQATLERWRQSIMAELKATSEGMPTVGYSGVRTAVLDEIEEAKRRLAEHKPDR